MKNNFAILLIFSFPSIIAQPPNRPYARLDFKPAVGFNTSPATLELGEITDYLVDYDFNAFYWQIFSGSYYVFKNWGVEVTAQWSNSGKFRNKSSSFEEDLEATYGNQYFVTTLGPPGRDDYSTAFFEGEIIQGYIGLVYRIQNDKLQAKAKCLFGTKAIDLSGAKATLKEKGTHTILELNYEKPGAFDRNFAISPGFSVGYRFYKRFLINVDILYTYSTVQFKFHETTTNVITAEQSDRYYRYENSIHSFSAGIGITLEFGKIRPRKKE